MTPKEKAQELVSQMENDFQYFASKEIAKRHALIAVMEIINSNPHSNPFNTDVHSTISFWIQVRKQIKRL